MLQPNYFGAMMVAMHQAVGFVSGTNQSTGSVLRPLFQIIKVAPQATTASSCQVMEVEDTRFGENGVLLMGDCGVIPDPTVEQLADIAVSTAQLARQLVGVRPRVALLSFSTKGSARHPSIGKVQAATALAEQHAHEKGIEADFDGVGAGDCGAEVAREQGGGERECVDFPGFEFGQHREQAGAAYRAGECLRANPAGAGPAGGGCFARVECARYFGRGGDCRRAEY
jgi:hypothetical protein